MVIILNTIEIWNAWTLFHDFKWVNSIFLFIYIYFNILINNWILLVCLNTSDDILITFGFHYVIHMIWVHTNDLVFLMKNVVDEWNHFKSMWNRSILLPNAGSNLYVLVPYNSITYSTSLKYGLYRVLCHGLTWVNFGHVFQCRFINVSC